MNKQIRIQTIKAFIEIDEKQLVEAKKKLFIMNMGIANIENSLTRDRKNLEELENENAPTPE